MTDKEAIEILKPLIEYRVENGIGTFPMVSTPSQVEALELAIKTLEERPTNEWKIVEEERQGIVWKCICTECGHNPLEYIYGTENWQLRKTNLPNFCPSCGADMRGSKNEND